MVGIVRAVSIKALVSLRTVESTPRIFYAAAATGGLFKTENNGLNFTPVFENQPVASIGAVAVSQSNPNVLYLGSGEGNSSRSSYWGNGVYVSLAMKWASCKCVRIACCEMDVVQTHTRHLQSCLPI